MKREYVLLLVFLTIMIVASSGCIKYTKYQPQTPQENNTTTNTYTHTQQNQTVEQNTSEENKAISAELQMIKITIQTDNTLKVTPILRTDNGETISLNQDEYKLNIVTSSADLYTITIEIPQELTINGQEIKLKNQVSTTINVNAKYGIIYAPEMRVLYKNGHVMQMKDKLLIYSNSMVIIETNGIKIRINREAQEQPTEFAIKFTLVNGQEQSGAYAIIKITENGTLLEDVTTETPNVPILGYVNVYPKGQMYSILPVSGVSGVIKIIGDSIPLTPNPMKVIYVKPNDKFIIIPKVKNNEIIVVMKLEKILNKLQEINKQETNAQILTQAKIAENIIIDEDGQQHKYYFLILSNNTFNELFNNPDLIYEVSSVYFNNRKIEVNISNDDIFSLQPISIAIQIDNIYELQQPFNLTFEFKNGSTQTITVKVNNNELNKVNEIENRLSLKITNTGELEITKFDDGIKVLTAYYYTKKLQNPNDYKYILSYSIGDKEVQYYNYKPEYDNYNYNQLVISLEQEQPIKDTSKIKPGNKYVVYDSSDNIILIIYVEKDPLTGIMISIGGTIEASFTNKTLISVMQPLSANTKYEIYGLNTINMLTLMSYSEDIMINYIFQTTDNRFEIEPNIIKYDITINDQVGNVGSKTLSLYHYEDNNGTTLSHDDIESLGKTNPEELFLSWALVTLFTSLDETAPEFYYPTYNEGYITSMVNNFTIDKEYNIEFNIISIDYTQTELMGKQVTMTRITYEIPEQEVGKVFVIFPYYIDNWQKIELVKVNGGTKVDIQNLPFAIYSITGTQFTIEFPFEATYSPFFGINTGNPFGQVIIPYIMYSPKGDAFYNGNVIVKVTDMIKE